MENNTTFTTEDLLNSSKLKSIFKQFSSKELVFLIDKLTKIKDDVLKEEEQAAQEKAQKVASAKEVLDLLKEKGLTIDEITKIASIENKPRKGKAKFEPKYEWINEDGSHGYWSGQGMIPRALRTVMQKEGVSEKEYFLIPEKKEEEN